MLPKQSNHELFVNMIDEEEEVCRENGDSPE
jgi:hypothetical protein